METVIGFKPLFQFSYWSVTYWGIALLMSVFWGWYSLEDVKKDQPNRVSLFERLTRFDAFISDFTLSLLGWGALYLLLWNGQDGKFENFDIFLGSVAVLCITGYGFKIAERIKMG